MNYTFLPSLEHVVLVKLATTLWNSSDIRALIVKFEFEGRLYYKEYSIILKDIEEKVLLLNYPMSLKEKILCVIKPIGLQVYRWTKHTKSYNLAVNVPNEFSWTPYGTIDRKKTAEALITDETIDITERYKLACIYCLKNYVGALWEKMPENHRASFYNEDDPKNVAQHDLVVISTYDIKGEMAKLENIRWRPFQVAEITETYTPEQWAFECAFFHSNKEAAEYFWNKLSLEEREDSLRFLLNDSIIRYNNFFLPDGFDILRFVFLHMTKDQQIAVFQKYPLRVLQCFLQWPWQNLFMEMTNHVVLTNPDYWNLLYKIVTKVTEGCKDYDYQRLFGELWQKSTEDHKKYVIALLCRGRFLLLFLFRNKDMKNISLILKDASVLEKAAMCNCVGSRIFSFLYRKKEFDMLEFFINEFISSHEMMIKFKGKCMMMSWYDDRVKKIFDDLIEKLNLKRTL